MTDYYPLCRPVWLFLVILFTLGTTQNSQSNNPCTTDSYNFDHEWDELILCDNIANVTSIIDIVGLASNFSTPLVDYDYSEILPTSNTRIVSFTFEILDDDDAFGQFIEMGNNNALHELYSSNLLTSLDRYASMSKKSKLCLSKLY